MDENRQNGGKVAGDRRFQLLVESVRDYAIYMLDPTGVIVSWNSGAERFKGYKASEIIGEHFSRFYTEEDKASGLPARALQTALDEGKFEAEGWRVRKDGTRFWTSVVIDPIHDETGQLVGFAKITRDITQKKAAEQALYESEQRFRLLVQGVRDYAIYMLDPTGKIISWNSGAERFKGYKASEIIGQHFSRFYTEEDKAVGLPARALKIAREEGKFEAEGWRVRKDGTRFWTSVVIDPIYADMGELIGFAKITRDITQKKAAEQALYESEQRFRMLVQGVRDYAIYMLDRNGNVSNWNTGAEAIKGYTAEEIVGQHFSRFYTDEDRANGEPARALATAIREGKYEREAWRQRKDGTRFWASIVIDPIYDDRGELVGFAKITRDMTERRLAQEEIERTREALSQAQKMEAVGRLTGGVAHDFNNLLTVIRSSADLLRRPGLSEEKRTRYLEAIAETAERAALLTGQLLAFARRQPLRRELFDIGSRIHGLKHIISTTVGSPVAVTFDVAEDVGAVVSDPNQFETAVINMIINARDAMPNGGNLRIGARRLEEPPAICRNSKGACDYIAVEIEDNGVGIDPSTLDRIFEPFFTTKEVNKGTGLGLSQVYGFAKQSAGEIEVKSEPGEGTTFTLYLPRAAGEGAGASDKEEQDPQEREVGSGRILMVEDNDSVGRFAVGLLTELGQNVTWAIDGQEALGILDQRSHDFDLVITDVVMPGMSGIELAHRIEESWPDLPVVLTSGYSHILAEEGSHGFDLLQKPYSIDTVLDVLRRHLSSDREDKAA